MNIESVNPSTEKVLKSYACMSKDEIEQRVQSAHLAQKDWQVLSIEERCRPLMRMAELLEERAESLGRLATLEMGKPLAEAEREVRKCALVCRHYAEKSADYLSIQAIESDASKSFVRYDPLGLVLSIMPWNFPFWQVFRFAAPTLMAGNGTLLKHAPNVPQCAEAIESLFVESGFPSSLLTNLVIDIDPVADLISDSRIAAVTLTGSGRAGRAVAEAAGRALKPVVLELGGSDPFVVLEDADLEKAVEHAIISRFLNNGQSCIAAKRLIVVDAVHDEFVERFAHAMGALVMGDPLKPTTRIGPLAQARFRTALHEQVQKLVDEGARCVTGGTIPEGEGFYYPPTLLVDISASSKIIKDEIFGPVASVIRVPDQKAAIDLANAVDYGLGASVWTQDHSLVDGLTAQLNAGAVFVNGMVKSDPRLPFGGIKQSGIGRELGREGILEFVNTKTVWIA
ncbi:MAG: NAD-dependent succinate-semialdehyde dehydrogenase [Myxococcota bacterium]|nr:NAD-dependent succinate-semialdehyde dehydrogenase [Myxococcota bacterium]